MAGVPSSSLTSRVTATAPCASEQDIDLAAEAEILGSLAHVEARSCLAQTSVTAVDLDDSIFQGQAGEGAGHGAVVEEGQVEPAIGDLGRGNGLGRVGLVRRGLDQRRCVGAFGLQLGGDAGLVMNLDQEDGPAVLGESRRGRAGAAFTRLSGLTFTPMRQ